MPDLLCFRFVDMKLSVLVVVAEGNNTTHPHPLFLRGGDFISYPLSRDLPFKLSKGQQNIEGQTTHGRGGIELLCDRDKTYSLAVERLDDLCKVSKRASQTINLIDNNGIDFARSNIF